MILKSMLHWRGGIPPNVKVGFKEYVKMMFLVGTFRNAIKKIPLMPSKIIR